MPRPASFEAHLVERVGRDLDGLDGLDIQADGLQARNLVWVVGQQHKLVQIWRLNRYARRGQCMHLIKVPFACRTARAPAA